MTIALMDLQDFMEKYQFVAVEWDGKELTVFRPNPRCDVQAEPGLEPFGESEFTGDTKTAIRKLQYVLDDEPPFFYKAPPVRYPVAEDAMLGRVLAHFLGEKKSFAEFTEWLAK